MDAEKTRDRERELFRERSERVRRPDALEEESPTMDAKNSRDREQELFRERSELVQRLERVDAELVALRVLPGVSPQTPVDEACSSPWFQNVVAGEIVLVWHHRDGVDWGEATKRRPVVRDITRLTRSEWRDGRRVGPVRMLEIEAVVRAAGPELEP
jgi:hypothetical protein